MIKKDVVTFIGSAPDTEGESSVYQFSEFPFYKVVSAVCKSCILSNLDVFQSYITFTDSEGESVMRTEEGEIDIFEALTMEEAISLAHEKVKVYRAISRASLEACGEFTEEEIDDIMSEG